MRAWHLHPISAQLYRTVIDLTSVPCPCPGKRPLSLSHVGRLGESEPDLYRRIIKATLAGEIELTSGDDFQCPGCPMMLRAIPGNYPPVDGASDVEASVERHIKTYGCGASWIAPDELKGLLGVGQL